MRKLVSSFCVVFLASSLALAQNNPQAQNCGVAYSILNGNAHSLEFAANNLTNLDNRFHQQDDFNQIRLAQFEQTRQQIEANRQAALNYNRGNTGSCIINSFLFGRGGNCVSPAVVNGINIRINFDNQQRLLEINLQNYIRFAQSQQQRMVKNIQDQMAVFSTQKQRCYDAQSRAQTCTLFPRQVAPQYPSVTCDIDMPQL